MFNSISVFEKPSLIDSRLFKHKTNENIEIIIKSSL